MNNIYVHSVIYKTWLSKLQGEKKNMTRKFCPPHVISLEY